MAVRLTSLLTNDEVLAVNQDALGRMARTVSQDGERHVLAKPLADGSLAVGLLSRGDAPIEVTAAWGALGLQGPHRVRDLWRQADLPEADGEVSATVNPHGVVLLRLTPAR